MKSKICKGGNFIGANEVCYFFSKRQAKNAARFAERGLVRVLPEGELSADTLPKYLAGLAADTRLRAALAAAPSPRGNEKILAVLAEVMR